MRFGRGSVVAVAVLCGCGGGDPAPPAGRATATATAAAERPAAFGALERRFDARVGVYAVDTGSGREVAHRGCER